MHINTDDPADRLMILANAGLGVVFELPEGSPERRSAFDAVQEAIQAAELLGAPDSLTLPIREELSNAGL